MPGNYESVGLQYQPIYDLSGGMVTNQNFASIKKNQFILGLNGDMFVDGAFQKRRGRRKLNPNAISGNPTINSLRAIGQIAGADLMLAGTGIDIWEISTGVPILVKSGLTAGSYAASTVLDNYVFYCNGFDKPFMTQGTAATTYDVGIPQVTNPQFAGFSVAATAGGDGTNGTHRVTFRYRSTITGARSNPNFASATSINFVTVTLGAGNNTYTITVGAAMVSTDPQVNFIDYFVQEAGANVDAPYYYLGSSPNAVGVYSFGTGVDDNSLIVKETIDIDDNQPPVTLRDLENFRARLLGIVDDYHVQFSKQRIDQNGFLNLPTSWPATNSLEVGFGDGDPLVKVVSFYDYIFAFKKRSIWILQGDFSSPGFGFKKLKTNLNNVGLLNQKCIAQASDKIFFVTDSLKFQYFSITDFDTQQVRLPIPSPSDRVANLFSTFLSGFRNNVNLVNYSWSEYTQIWTAFSDGNSQLDTSNNFNVFVFDHTADNGVGGWHIHTGIEVASSVLAKDINGNYNVYTGDYYGFVWQNGITDGDGAFINSTSTGGNTVSTFNDTTQVFDPSQIGCFISIIGGTGAGQIRRVTSINSPTQIGITPNWTATEIPDSTSIYTIGGIDFQLWSRFDWLDEAAPPDFDKEGWYLDIDAETNFGTNPGNNPFLAAPNYGFIVQLVKDRGDIVNTEITRSIVIPGTTWGSGIWGFSLWGFSNKLQTQVGFDLFFKSISHRIRNPFASQFVKINGWTYCFQNLNKIRLV